MLLVIGVAVSLKEVKNPDVTLTDENIQRNRNLAENKRVDIAVVAIAIADNIVKNNYINILPQSLATYLYYIDILYNIKMTGCSAMTPQQGGSRRRRRNTRSRSRKNKTRRNGKCRACRCPGGCKRSTCPCYRGRSKPCCTKRCKSRGHRCRC